MSFYAIRFREYDGKIHKTKSHTSSNGVRYMAGEPDAGPSPLYITADTDELTEISEHPQAQVMKFEAWKELDGLLVEELQNRVRAGKPAMRAEVTAGAGMTFERVRELSRGAAVTRSVEPEQPQDPAKKFEARAPVPVIPRLQPVIQKQQQEPNPDLDEGDDFPEHMPIVIPRRVPEPDDLDMPKIEPIKAAPPKEPEKAESAASKAEFKPEPKPSPFRPDISRMKSSKGGKNKKGSK
jgi:hypothetical protein